MVRVREFLFFLLLITSVLESQSADDKSASNSLCTGQQNCASCLQADPACSWCQDPGLDQRVSRCDFSSLLRQKGCPEDMISQPANNLKIVQNTPPGNKVQLSPQIIKLRMRPRSSITLTLNFQQARLPLDLYYLMDLSNSMLDDKRKVASLGRQLAEEMRNLSRDFRLGFGSFVDKTVMPYISVVPRKMVSPCDGCAAPYGYKHHMTLSEDASQFEGQVDQAPISGNLDSPEGGFDALMQAMACKTQVGWRENARKMLVFSTDAGFHSAGDGKLGGVVVPNDALCHLERRDGEFQYTHSSEQDYPSVGQIARAVADHEINLLFVVTEGQVPVYSRLAELIKGSITGQLANDSSNVVELIKDLYNKITSTVHLQDTAPADFIKVSYSSSCLGENSIRTNECKGLAIGSQISWKLDIEILKAPPAGRSNKLVFQISPVASKENVRVELEILSLCDCEKDAVKNAPTCNGNGTSSCGICNCSQGSFGRRCECNADSIPGEDKNAGCRLNNSTQLCSGQGQCVCGECQCYSRGPGHDDEDEAYSGQFCECDNFSCDRWDNKICGGAEHGTCQCGKCSCAAGWTGPACACLTSTDTCMASNGKLCNDRGKCVCGRCVCDAEGGSQTSLYYGPTCENCPTCPGMCNTLQPCVQCQAFGTGELENLTDTGAACASHCKLFTAQVVDQISEEEPGRKVCQFRDDNDLCTVFFSYLQDETTGKLSVDVQRSKACPVQISALPIVLGVIFGILFVGLVLLLIWRLYIYLYDRRQVKKFQKELAEGTWQETKNPIFVPASQTYHNPRYETKKPL